MRHERSIRNPPGACAVSLAVGLLALVIYVATAARAITWWGGSQYPLAAWTLGITAPPGSLLLTLYGWAVSHVPVVHPVAFRLALGAALLAAVTSALVTWLSIHLATARARAGAAEVTAGGLVGLAFVSSRSVWMHAVQFQPYILTALFTALILAAASRWWNRARERDDGWGLFVVFLLLGLDFSVHRTNSLLLPALLVWVTLRRPRVWIRPRAMLAMGAGLVLGLGFHLLLIPLSRRDPWLDLGEPRTLGGFWSYVSLAQMGGGFLFRILPRTADFLDVQLADYLRFFRINVLPAGPGIPLTWLPGGLLLVGWGLRLRHARSERRDGRSGDLPDGTGRRLLGLLVLFLCSSVGAVVYFNLPAHYFRSMDRHYIPSLVLFAPLAAVAIAEIFRRTAARFSRQRGSARARWWWPVLVAVFLLPPLGSWWANRRDCDLSRVAFAEGCARDFLAPLPPDAILLTGGDNDTFPLWYLQRVEGVRPDVAVINVPLTNLGFYAARLGEPAWIGSPWPRDAGAQGPVSVADSTVTIPVTAGMRGGLPATVAASDTLRITLSGLLLPQDFVVLEILRASGHRPVYLASTISPSQLAWIRPFLRLDGLAYRFVPSRDPAVQDLGRLRHRLLEQLDYAGIADPDIEIDDTSRMMSRVYLSVLLTLAQSQLAEGDSEGCEETLQFLERKIPEARIGGYPEALTILRQRVGPAP